MSNASSERVEKQNLVSSLSESFKAAQITVCADYRGMSVAQMTNLRKELRKNGCRGVVVKNTLAKLAIDKVFAPEDAEQSKKFQDVFAGPSFVVYSDVDPISPAKIVSKFQKDFQFFKVKGAWFESAFIDTAGVEQLSSMPSREETLAKLLCLINTPATQLLRVMQAPGTQLVRVLEAYREKLAA